MLWAAVGLTSCGADTRRCADAASSEARYTGITARGTTCAIATLLAVFYVESGSVTATEPEGHPLWRATDIEGPPDGVRTVHAASGDDRVTFTVHPRRSGPTADQP